MTSTLRSPTYPSYENRVVDISAESNLTFINNADYPLLLSLQFKDLDSGLTSGTAIYTSAARGSTISVGLTASNFTAGHDYACTPTIYGRDPNADEGSLSPGKYDVLLGTGRVQADSEEDNTKIYIDKDITCIKTAWYDSTKLIGGCAIKVSNDTYIITAYNSSTGECTVTSASINGSTSSLRFTSAGEKYQLIGNYVVGSPFVFKYRSTPTCTLSYDIEDSILHITGTYSQAQGVPIQSYVMRAWYQIDNLDYTITHERKYGVTIAEDFPVSAAASGNMYVYCEITTEDGATKDFTLAVPAPQTVGMVAVSISDIGTLTIEDMPAGSTAYIWREEKFNRAGIDNYNELRYMGSVANNEVTVRDGSYTDQLRANLQGYRYRVALVESDGTISVTAQPTSQYNENSRTCLLWQLERLGNSRYRMVQNAYFTFSCDLDSGTIEHITSNAAHKSSGKLPKYIRGTDSYDIGTLTAILGTVSSPEATPYDIKRFIDIMSSDGIFLLKTDYGDIKIVGITSNPVRQYGASIEELGITRVTIGWTEIDSIETAVIE